MSGVVVTARVSRYPVGLRLAVSTSADLSSPTYFTPVSVTSGVARFELSGLAANTQHYCALEINSVLQLSTIGQFKTLPVGASSFKIAIAGDARTGSRADTFTRVLEQAPLLFIHLGDMHYENIDEARASRFRQAYRKVLASPTQAELYQRVPTVYVWDDHDYGANDADGSSVTRDTACEIYREQVPHLPLEEAGPTGSIYHSFEIGRCVFIVMDQRSEASPKGSTDDAAKTMLGAAQKAWVKSVLSDVANASKLFVLICPRLWGGVATAGADHWGGFTTERTELCDYIQANCPGRVCVISADMHSLAIDDGTNHDFVTTGSEPLPTFQVSPLDQGEPKSYGGGTYSEGKFNGDNQFGVMEVTDSGGATITVDWSGYDSAGQLLVSHQFVVSV